MLDVSFSKLPRRTGISFSEGLRKIISRTKATGLPNLGDALFRIQQLMDRDVQPVSIQIVDRRLLDEPGKTAVALPLYFFLHFICRLFLSTVYQHLRQCRYSCLRSLPDRMPPHSSSRHKRPYHLPLSSARTDI